jgi:hypothetical protein
VLEAQVTLFLLGAASGAIVSMLAIVAYCVCVCRWLTKETE